MTKNRGKWECPWCGGSLYVIDSTLLSHWIRRRTWCCIDCGRRYRSLEAMDIRSKFKGGVPEGLDRKFEA